MNAVDYEIVKNIAGNTLNITKKPGAKYDETALKIFRADCPYFAAPVSEAAINGETIFSYDLGSCVPIESVNMKMSGSEFIRLLKNLITPLTDCCDWLLDSHCFIMRPELVFVRDYDYAVRYIYSFEIGSGNNDSEITAFFSALIKTVRITDSTDLSNVLLRMVVDNNVSAASLLDMIKRYESVGSTMRRETVPPAAPAVSAASPAPKKASAETKAVKAVNETREAPKKESKPGPKLPVLPSIMPQKPDKSEEKRESAPAAEAVPSEKNEAMEILFGKGKKEKAKPKPSKPPKGKSPILPFLKKEKGTDSEPQTAAAFSQQAATPAPAPAYTPPEEDDGKTVFAFADGVTELAGSSPYLALKENTGTLNPPERIELIFNENGETYIERQSEDSDRCGYKFDPAFKKISRMHAKITCKDNVYCITDIGSVNNTFMNGQVLQINREYPLNDGALLVFGDNHYVYEFKER